ncbi:MAG: 1,4-dihydroxy-2-naphthoate octaprenyltransferase [Verrucomicrobiales bacterium]|nr:1,4-dihydroxy-2-naphthoate octaprenyltransferase [Verrucomicrobiales bacterium]
MSPWLLAARPKTLPAAVVPVWVGNLPALLDGDEQFSWLLLAATLLSCLCIQIATNLFNDAIDFKKGADTENRLGPVRVTATGLLSQKQVMLAAGAFCLLAAFIAIPLVQARGWGVVAIGVVSLLLAYGYTGGPVPLAYKGLGEIFVILFFGLVAVIGSFWVQTGIWPAPQAVVIFAVQTGLLSAAMIAINNLRDTDEDRQTGKRTLAVRFGKTYARSEVTAFCLGPVALAAVSGNWLVFLLLPLSLFVVKGVWKNDPGPVYNKLLAISGLQLLAFAVLLTLDLRFFGA